MFREIILPIFRSTRLCVTACGVMHPPRCCRPKASWINVNNCPTRCDYIQFYYISANSSTCSEWYPHLSSGAHVHCNYSNWHNFVPTPPRQQKVANTVWPVPDAVITVYVCSWWWVKVSLETCRAVCRNIIQLYIVASSWTIIDISSSEDCTVAIWKGCMLHNCFNSPWSRDLLHAEFEEKITLFEILCLRFRTYRKLPSRTPMQIAAPLTVPTTMASVRPGSPKNPVSEIHK